MTIQKIKKSFFHILLIGLCSIPSGYAQSSFDMDDSQESKYEQMARDQGYSQSDIELAKQKYQSGQLKTNQMNRANQQNNSIKVQKYGYDDFDSLDENQTSKSYDSLQFRNQYPKDQYPREKYLKNKYSREVYDKNDSTNFKNEVQPAVDTNQLQYFGYDIFKNVPDAFKPNSIGPVDPGYLVGPGDVLRLTVWGQAEFQYELTVSKEGKVFIPVAGQVYVTGVPFDQLQDKIKALLSRNYSGLSSVPQRTFMDLTIARVRPVRIFVMGEVSQPGGYTVSSFATAFNALYSVGGPLDKGSLRNIKVLRNGKEIATVDIYDYLLSGTCTTDVRLQNNDVVFVPPRGKTVAVTGSVFRPAYYELKDSDQFNSLLNYCGGISSLTNIDRAQLYRVLPFDKRDGVQNLSKVVDINLKECIIQKKELNLYDKDSISFTPLYSDLKNKVKLSGAVQYPGYYESDTLTLSSLIYKLGKVVDEKYFSIRADLFRLNPDLVTKKVIPIDLERLKTDPSYDQKLNPGDEVVVYDKTVERPIDLLIRIEGEVNHPGVCTLSTNMTVMDALIHAGGFTRKAYKKSVDVYRMDPSRVDALCKVFKVDLPDSINYLDESLRNFPLEDRDRIVVRVDPSYNDVEFVKITGKVRFQGSYALINRTVRLVEIIDRAGGPMPEAFLEGAMVYRGGNRVVVNCEKAYYEKKEKENIILQPGDSIFIPGKPNTVSVFGNVNNPGLFSFVEGAHVGSYLNRAGGLADSSQYVLLTAPNGGTQKIKGRRGPEVLDGSTIYVTKKPYVDDSKKNQGPSVAEIIKDTLAIITSVVGIVVLAVKLN